MQKTLTQQKDKLVSKKPQISSFTHPTLSSIMIKSDQSDFTPLGSARDCKDNNTFTDFGNLLKGSNMDQFIDKDPYPLPQTIDREGYHDNRHYDYWLSGLRDYLNLTSNLKRLGHPLKPDARVYEFGCASGRVLRHFAFQGGYDSWGTDINIRHTEWMRLFLPNNIKVFQNTIYPSLPIEDNYFDLVFAYSVFTHIDDLELSWLAELRRILKPGGIAYITIQSDDTWDGLKSNDWTVKNSLLNMKEYIKDFEVNEEFFNQPMPQDRLVFWWPFSNAYNSVVFYTKDYIRSAWGRFFDILEIKSRDSEYQDGVFLQKKA